jgi:putative nucleotidyltransferase with HDIG domain
VNVLPRLSSLGHMNTLASWAGQLAQVLLQESLPRRWAHVQGVAARARSLAPVLGADADLLEAAAWLHDIGYAPDLATTGLHALDGARFLRDAQDADALLCRLVAHHSCAIIEAEERGLGDVLSLEFEPAPQALSSVLTFCDMTTSPDGEPVTVGRRLAEIHHRYGPGHLVSRSIQRATPMILRAVTEPPGAHSSADRKRGNACVPSPVVGPVSLIPAHHAPGLGGRGPAEGSSSRWSGLQSQ